MMEYDREKPPGSFDAKYKGQCAYCFEEIKEGDRCMYWRKNIYHVPCKHEAYKEKVGQEYPLSIEDAFKE